MAVGSIAYIIQIIAEVVVHYWVNFMNREHDNANDGTTAQFLTMNNMREKLLFFCNFFAKMQIPLAVSVCVPLIK